MYTKGVYCICTLFFLTYDRCFKLPYNLKCLSKTDVFIVWQRGTQASDSWCWLSLQQMESFDKCSFKTDPCATANMSCYFKVAVGLQFLKASVQNLPRFTKPATSLSFQNTQYCCHIFTDEWIYTHTKKRRLYIFGSNS